MNWTTIIVAIIGFLGTLLAVVGNVIIVMLQHRSSTQPGPPPNPKLLEWQSIGIACLLLSLTALIVLVVLPGEENTWFVRMNKSLVLVAGGSCLTIFALLFLGSKQATISRSQRGLTMILLKACVYFVFIIFIGSFGYLGVLFAGWQQLPPNAKLVFAGWHGYNMENYRLAIDATDRCTDRFGTEATTLEAGLAGTPMPQPGKPTQDTKNAIDKNGVLNDVATCYWIKGSISGRLHDTTSAKNAFSAACRLSHSMTWDPKGWFWSPAKDGCDRVQDRKLSLDVAPRPFGSQLTIMQSGGTNPWV